MAYSAFFVIIMAFSAYAYRMVVPVPPKPELSDASSMDSEPAVEMVDVPQEAAKDTDETGTEGDKTSVVLAVE